MLTPAHDHRHQHRHNFGKGSKTGLLTPCAMGFTGFENRRGASYRGFESSRLRQLARVCTQSQRVASARNRRGYFIQLRRQAIWSTPDRMPPLPREQTSGVPLLRSFS